MVTEAIEAEHAELVDRLKLLSASDGALESRSPVVANAVAAAANGSMLSTIGDGVRATKLDASDGRMRTPPAEGNRGNDGAGDAVRT